MNHLEEKHGLNKDSPIVKKRKIMESFQMASETPNQAFINRRIEELDPIRFRRALIYWMAYSNIAFHQIETELVMSMDWIYF